MAELNKLYKRLYEHGLKVGKEKGKMVIGNLRGEYRRRGLKKLRRYNLIYTNENKLI